MNRIIILIIINARSAIRHMRFRIASFFKNKLNLFYLLALLPLLLIFYFGYVKRGDVVTWIIPFYGFLLLYMKKDKMSTYAPAAFVFQVMGIVLLSASFFVYFVVVSFYPPAQFYGEANYLILIVGLFLIYFEPRALKQALSALVLIVGATAIPFFGVALESYLWPAIPFFAQVVSFILKVLTIPATRIDSNVFMVTPLHSSPVLLSIIPACVSIYSVSTFSILIAVTLIEDHTSSPREKLLWGIGGVIGTFFLNLVRVSFIFVVIYFFGYENWPAIHSPVGYVLFLTWIGLFFLLFSERHKISRFFQPLVKKSKNEESTKLQEEETAT